MLGADDSRITARKSQISLRETDFADPASDGGEELFNGISNEGAENAAESAKTPVESVKEPEKVQESELVSDESAEPSQERLDELEFYITIEDFVSATQLLEELIECFPNSKFLKEIKTSIPKTKGE